MCSSEWEHDILNTFENTVQNPTKTKSVTRTFNKDAYLQLFDAASLALDELATCSPNSMAYAACRNATEAATARTNESLAEENKKLREAVAALQRRNSRLKQCFNDRVFAYLTRGFVSDVPI